MDNDIQQNKTSQASKTNDTFLLPIPSLSDSYLGPRKTPEGDEGERGDPLLYLYSNNSNEIGSLMGEAETNDLIVALCNFLTPYHKKQAQNLFLNCQRLIKVYAISVNHVGLFTLTFPDSVTSNKEASRRFNSFLTGFLSKYPEIGHWLLTKEQQKKRGFKEGNSGAWHYHLLVCLMGDIKTGIDFEALKNRDYRSAPPYLRKIWKDFREAMPKYGFGRSELLPIRSNAEAMARYIGKYISKHIGQRDASSKGVRLISSSRGWVKNSANFAWNTAGAQEWRRKLKFFAMSIGCQEFYQITEVLGPKWAYKYSSDIFEIYKYVDRVYANKDVVFESPTVKKISGNKKKREAEKVNLQVNDKKKRDVEDKKRETKNYMGKLTSDYVEDWLTDNNQENPLSDSLKRTKEEKELYSMKKRCHIIEKYNNEQTTFILNTGEEVPF